MLSYKTVVYGDPLLPEFCNKVYALESDKTYLRWFSDDRLSRLFYNIELCLVDNIPISFSGCSIVDNRLRISQQHYTLPTYRNQYRDILIRKSGFIDRHIRTARLLKLDTLLITLHGFNKKTNTLINILDKKRNNYRHLNKFYYCGINNINNTDQLWYEMKI